MAMAYAERSDNQVFRGRREGRGQFLRAVKPLLPLLILLYSFFIFPPEVKLTVLSANIPLYRLIAIIFSWKWIASYSRKDLHFTVVDGLISFSSLWMIVAFLHHYGAGTGFIRGMGIAIDTAGSYFLARSCIRTPAQLRLLFLLLVPGLALAGLEMLLESFRKDFIVRPAFARIFGQVSGYSAGADSGAVELRREFRIGGLMRAMGPFSHPILGGITLTSTLLIYMSSGIRSWPRIVGCGAAVLGFFALSSATILAIMLAVFLFASDIMLRRLQSVTWWIVLALVILLIFFLEFSSQGGVVNLLVRQTLDPQTGYYRKLIWEYGLKSVGNNMLYGIGYAEYERPLSLLPSGSVDAHFLATGIAFGVLVSFTLLLGAIIAVFRLGAVMGGGKGADRNLLFGLNGALLILLASSMTVTYFGEARIWFMAIIGMAVSMGQLVLHKAPAASDMPLSSQLN